MHIEIPAEAESMVRGLAAATGHQDVQAYVLDLLYSRNQAQQSLETATSDPYYAERVLEGLQSGEATPLTSEDFSAVRQSLSDGDSPL